VRRVPVIGEYDGAENLFDAGQSIVERLAPDAQDACCS
jgi:hypothetical protein